MLSAALNNAQGVLNNSVSNKLVVLKPIASSILFLLSVSSSSENSSINNLFVFTCFSISSRSEFGWNLTII